MPNLQDLSALSRQTLASLISLQERLSSSGSGTQRLEDIQERFKLWSGNIGALHPFQDQQSLEHRVRAAPKLKARFAELLGDLGDDLDELRSLLDSHDSEGWGEDFDRAFHDLIETLNESIRNLFKISGIARKSAIRDRYALALNRVPASQVTEEEIELDIIGDLFPRLRFSEYNWLRARLAKANNLRRRYLQYCEGHQAHVETGTFRSKEDTVSIDLQLPKVLDESMIETGPQSVKSTATTVNAAAFEAATTEGDDVESIISAFSYDTESAAHMRYGVVDLEQVNNGEECFVCPYCRQEQFCISQDRWKRHVLSDLKAYVCIDEECSVELFENSRSWMHHQLSVHLSRRCCPYCEGDHSYHTANELKTHLRQEHQAKFHEEQIAQISNLSKQEPANLSASACPFCDWQAKLEYQNPGRDHGIEISVSLQRYRRHVGSHLEQVALAVLQIEEVEGSERGSQDLDEDLNDITNLDEILLDDPGETHDKDMDASLCTACEEGNYEMVWRLLHMGADVNAQSRDGIYPLHRATVGGYEKIVQTLINAGADLDKQAVSQPVTALQAACAEGYANIVQILITAGADVNAKGGIYASPLHAACLERPGGGYAKILQMLFDAGADPDVQGLLPAVSEKGYENVVLILLDNGADPNAISEHQESALKVASREGHVKVVQMLLDYGADVNERGNGQESALEAASREGHVNIVLLLIESGADVNAKGREYNNALETASYRGHEKVKQILLEASAQFNARSLT